MLVVNDAPLAEAIDRLRGEWALHSGGTLQATSTAWSDLDLGRPLDADVIVFPARYLGAACEANLLRPMRDGVLGGELYDARDVFPLVRRKLITYSGRDMALPLGVAVPLVGYPPAWLAGPQQSPPATWPEYHSRAGKTSAQPTWWPAADAAQHPAAIGLLARAAGYALSPTQEGVLFDPETMAPRIADPPFVRALDEWRAEFRGRPSASSTPEPTQLVWAATPAADESFDRAAGQWRTSAVGTASVPVLVDGTVIGVTASSHNAASAFGLVAWLASPDVSAQLGAAGRPMLPARRSQLKAVGSWIKRSAGDGQRLPEAVAQSLGSDLCLIVPRLPGIDEYLAALDEEVRLVLAGEAAPADALRRAADRWNQLTDRLGRDAQRQAYLRHLGRAGP